MSEDIQTVLTCFQKLHNPTTPEDPNEATRVMLENFTKPECFPFFLNLASNDSVEEYVRQRAIVHCGLLYRKFYLALPPETQMAIFTAMLPLLVYHQSEYVAEYILSDINTSITPEFLPQIIAFIAQIQANVGLFEIKAILNLYLMICKYPEVNIYENMPLIMHLIDSAVQTESIDLKVTGITAALKFAVIEDSEANNAILVNYLKLAMELLSSLTKQKLQKNLKYIKTLVDALQYVLDQQPECINPLEILQVCLELLSDTTIPGLLLEQISEISDLIIINYTDVITESQAVGPLLQVYFQYAMATFDPQEEEFDCSSTTHNIYSSIFVEFAKYPAILAFIWDIISKIISEPAGRFAAIAAIFYSLLDGQDFYEQKVDELSQLFVQGLSDDIPVTGIVSANAIAALAQSQKKQIKKVSSVLLSALFQRIQTLPKHELILAIDAIAAAGDLGSAFGALFQALTQLIQIPDVQIQMDVLKCLADMVLYSPKQARHYFTEIIQVCTQILSTPDAEILASHAISVLSFLIESSPKLFEPYIEQFLQIISQNLDSTDDNIIYESITGYGHLLLHFPAQIRGSIPTVFPKLLQYSNQTIDKIDNDEDIFYGDSNQDLDKVAEPKINVITASIRVLAQTLSTYPELINDNFEAVMTAIQNQVSQTRDSDVEKGCAEGCANLIKGIQSIGFDEKTKPLMSRIVEVLVEIASMENSESPTVGAAFTGISDIIASDENFGISCIDAKQWPLLFKEIEAVFTEGGKLFLMDGLDYMEELHDPAMRVIREIIAAKKNDSIQLILPFVPLFNGLIQHDDEEMRDLVLQFFGDMVYWASDAVDDELKRNTFILAFDAIQNRNSANGFGCIKQLSAKAPHVLEGNIPQILELIKNQLEIVEENPTEYLQSVQDNADSALAQIAINILPDLFPLDVFMKIALEHMPPQLEVEETNDHIRFFFWLMQRAQQLQVFEANILLFAAVPIRLFMDPIETLLGPYCVEQENVEKMQQFLRNFVGGYPNWEAFVHEICEEDAFKIESVLEALH